MTTCEWCGVRTAIGTWGGIVACLPCLGPMANEVLREREWLSARLAQLKVEEHKFRSTSMKAMWARRQGRGIMETAQR